MTRQFAPHAEIRRGPDQTLTEMMLPNSIDRDARREEVIGPCQPVSEFASTTPRRDLRWIGSRQHLGKTSRNRLAGSCGIAAEIDRCILETFVLGPHRPAVLHDDCLRNHDGGFLL